MADFFFNQLFGQQIDAAAADATVVAAAADGGRNGGDVGGEKKKRKRKMKLYKTPFHFFHEKMLNKQHQFWVVLRQ